MILKAVKIGVITVVGLGLTGGLVFGTDLFSYVSSSARSVKTAVKDSVPVDFELKRARDLLEDIIPEMQANIRLIAQEEVEVTGLKANIQQSEDSTRGKRVRVSKLRESLSSDQGSFAFAGMNYTRREVKDDLARQFCRLKEAELILAGKKRLLTTREKSLNAAVRVLERTRSQKAQLEDQIEALDAQYRLVKAAAVGSRFQVDNSKLAKTEKLIREIRKRLDVAERVLSHEARFVEPIQVDVVSEKDLIAEVDDHLSGPRADSLALSEADGGP